MTYFDDICCKHVGSNNIQFLSQTTKKHLHVFLVLTNGSISVGLMFPSDFPHICICKINISAWESPHC